MELKHLLQPCKVKSWSMAGILPGEHLGDSIHKLSDCNCVLSKDLYDVAIIGIEEGRNSPQNSGCGLSPELIRKYLYGLRLNSRSLKIIDLGNLLGKTLNDKYLALEEVVAILSAISIPVVVIGGSQEFTVPAFKGLKRIHNNKALTLVDSIIDVIPCSNDFSSQNYLNELCKIGTNEPIQLNIMALQRYLTGKSQEDFMLDKKINSVRLGEIKGNGIQHIEPLLRDSDMVSFDVSSISLNEMAAQINPMPNGLTAYEACQLAWFAGMSDRMSVFSFFELNSQKDKTNNGLFLGAQIIWHFLEGLANRNHDYPFREIESYNIYHVPLTDLDLHIRFFCNPDNDRWWVELPVKGERELFSCSKMDYHMIRENQIPDKWWSYLIETDCKSEKN
jgi:formiminoglutamase